MTVNAVCDCAIRTPSPNAAAEPCTTFPANTPAAVSRPDRRPPASEDRSSTKVSGPGISTSPTTISRYAPYAAQVT
jgi:hypothetical protein